MRLIFFTFFLSVIGIVCAQDAGGSGDSTPKYSNEFLNIGVSARSFGMGFTAVSFVDDVTAGFWNPAGLNNLQTDHQLSLMHSSYFGGLANYDYAAVATSIDENSKIGLSIVRFSVDKIPDTRFLIDANGAIRYENIEFFASADYGFFLSYARKLNVMGGIDAGGNLKIVHRTVGPFSKAWGFGFDFGLQKKFGKWKFGLVARDALGTFNAWTHNTDEVEEVYALTGNDIPINSLEITLPRLVVGLSRSFSISENFGILSSIDLDMTFDGKRNTLIRTELLSVDPKAGIELDFKKIAFFRAGINQFQQIKDFDGSTSWTSQPNFGLGVKIKQLTIDYALTDVGDLAPGLFSHVFSVTVDFNDEKE